MRKFSDTYQPVSYAETAHSDTDYSFRNTVFTYSTCFQAFFKPSHQPFNVRKRHFPMSEKALSTPENAELSSEKKHSEFKNIASYHRKLQKK